MLRNFRRSRQNLPAVLLLSMIILMGFTSLHDPAPAMSIKGDPPCRFDYTVPYHNTDTTCVEVIYDSIIAPEAVPHLAGLAVDGSDTLFFALTNMGEVWTLPDYDGDSFPDTPQLVTARLNLPTALAWHAEALYILTYSGVFRLDDPGTPGSSPSVLIPGWDQFGNVWPGSIDIGPDERLYISLSAACAYCPASEPGRGLLISYSLDGSDERVEASELVQPLDFAWHPATGQVWIGDSAPLALTDDAANHRFDRLISLDALSTPAVTFPYQSTPAGLVFYPNAAFPAWQGDLLLVLRGSWNLPEPAGYALAVVGFDSLGKPTGQVEFAAPATAPDSVYASYTVSQHSLTGQGFFPQHPVDVAVDSRGWIYVSIEEGRILRLRPRP